MAFSLDRFRVGDIASVAEFEILETYQDNIRHYEEANYSYIPVPFDERYVEVESRSVNELARKQIIRVDFTIKEAIERLQEYPFLIYKPPDWSKRYMIEDEELELTVRRSKATESNFVGRARDVVKNHPRFKQEVLELEKSEENYYIITPADLNTRQAKEMFYTLIAELETKLAERIEVTFSNSRSLFPDLSPRTIGRWEKAGLDDFQMHISEYMTLSEIQKVFAKSEKLRSQCGFESRNQFDKKMSGLIDLRNRVMHASRTIVHEQSDIEQLYDRICRAEELVTELDP